MREQESGRGAGAVNPACRVPEMLTCPPEAWRAAFTVQNLETPITDPHDQQEKPCFRFLKRGYKKDKPGFESGSSTYFV